MSDTFLTLTDFSSAELMLIGRAMQLKAAWKRGEVYEPLKNRTLAMIFENHPRVPAYPLKLVWRN